MTEKKIFKVQCVKCKKPFHVTFEKVAQPNPNAKEKGEVMVECPFCNQTVMIEIPRIYIDNCMPIYRGE